MTELHRVVKPGGKLILTTLPKEKWLTQDGKPDPGSEVCVPYSGDELVAMMRAAGFSHAHIQADANPEHASNYSVAGVK